MFCLIPVSSPRAFVIQLALSFSTQEPMPPDILWEWLIHGYFGYWGLPWWLSSKEPSCQSRRQGFDIWIRKIPRRRKWQPRPVFLLRKSHGQRSLMGYSPWGHKEPDTTEQRKNNNFGYLILLLVVTGHVKHKDGPGMFFGCHKNYKFISCPPPFTKHPVCSRCWGYERENSTSLAFNPATVFWVCMLQNSWLG